LTTAADAGSYSVTVSAWGEPPKDRHAKPLTTDSSGPVGHVRHTQATVSDSSATRGGAGHRLPPGRCALEALLCGALGPAARTQVSVFLDGFNFRRFLEDCYSENSRRMSAFEPELLRPSFLPQLAEAALKAMRLWNARTGQACVTLAGVLEAHSGALDDLRAWLSAGHESFAGDELERRLAHFVAETARVLPAAEAFRLADDRTLGEIALASQVEARDLLGNQIPATDRLAVLAREHGAFAATSFGAGFGGSVWALARDTDADRFAHAWLDAYRREFPDHTNAEWFVTRPAPPLTALALSG
jgi:hypothetical protein